MRKSLLLLAAAVAAVAVPTGNAEAQTWDAVKSFLNVCTMGSLNACGSVIVKTRVVGETTVVEMMVRNEQVPFGFDNTGGSFLTQIGLTAPQIKQITGFSVKIQGMVGEVGLPLLHWELKNGGLGGGVNFKAGTFPDGQGGIRGCDDPDGGPPIYFITCDAIGKTGWVVFSFTTANEWSANDAEIALKYQSIEGAYIEGGYTEDVSIICRTGNEGGEHACAVIPEPETYVLLLTGLVGIFAMGWLRRKKEQQTT